MNTTTATPRTTLAHRINAYLSAPSASSRIFSERGRQCSRSIMLRGAVIAPLLLGCAFLSETLGTAAAFVIAAAWSSADLFKHIVDEDKEIKGSDKGAFE